MSDAGQQPEQPAILRDTHSRRTFLASGSIALASVVWSPAWILRTFAAETPDSAKLIAGKDPGLIVYKADPPEIETPLKELRKHALTPASLLFVRNNQTLPGTLSTQPYSDSEWQIEFVGRLDSSRTISVAELKRMDQVEHELVLQCSGNGRAFFSRAAKVDGSQWRQGAMGNVRFKGVPFAAVLERLKVKVEPDVKFVTAEGRDAPALPTGADFEHSLPWRDVLARSFLALEMNGEPIPAVHGGPVRLITPGYYGTMQVKWLSRLRFETLETPNLHQIPRYRTPLMPIEPGAKFTATFDNSEPNWNMRVKSVIFAPLDGETVKAGEVSIQGVAWNDGSARITAVETSLDGGQTWRASKLKAPASPYAWYHWNGELQLEPGNVSNGSGFIQLVDAFPVRLSVCH